MNFSSILRFIRNVRGIHEKYTSLRECTRYALFHAGKTFFVSAYCLSVMICVLLVRRCSTILACDIHRVRNIVPPFIHHLVIFSTFTARFRLFVSCIIFKMFSFFTCGIKIHNHIAHIFSNCSLAVHITI